MSEDQRIVSQPIELHKLSIVDKHSQDQQQQQSVHSGLQSPRVTTPLKPKRLAIPISSPQRSSVQNGFVNQSPVSDNTSPVSADQDLIYNLAAKQREINELNLKLQAAQKELKQLELKFKNTLPQNEQQKFNSQNSNEYLSTFSRKIQQTLVDVNNSPNVLKSKRSINDFFNKSNRTTNDNSNNTMPIRRPNRSPNRTQQRVPDTGPSLTSKANSISRPPPLPSRDTKRNFNTTAPVVDDTPFLQRIMNKFSQMNTEEEEFDDFMEKGRSKKDNYIIKESMVYEYDEVRSDDDDEEFEPMGDIPIHLFKR